MESKTAQALAAESGRIVGHLHDLRQSIMALRRRLPEVPEAMTELAEPYTAEVELAVALEAIALDLGPLIQRLEEARAVTPERLRADWERAKQPLPAGDLPAPTRPPLHLETFSDAARRAIYEDVVKRRFQPAPSSLSPDDFELQVLYLFGRWMVVYRKLWDVAAPERVFPQEVLMVSMNERREPVYVAV